WRAEARSCGVLQDERARQHTMARTGGLRQHQRPLPVHADQFARERAAPVLDADGAAEAGGATEPGIAHSLEAVLLPGADAGEQALAERREHGVAVDAGGTEGREVADAQTRQLGMAHEVDAD